MASPAQTIPISKELQELIEENKTRGNVYFEKEEYSEAVKCYTECLEVCEKAVIYTNRALCYLKLSRPRLAHEDCDRALKLEPSNIKALYRRALANKALGRYSDSLWGLKTVLNLDPSNTATHKEYRTVVELWLCRTHDVYDKESKDEFELNVFLNCTSNQTTNKKSVISKQTLETISDVKLLIEQQLSIPASTQTLEYESHVFDDSTSLKSLRIQSGDTVYVKYSSEADCREVEEMAKWFFEVAYYMMKGCPSVDVGMDRTLDDLITLGINTNLFPSAKLFDDILDHRCCANMHHFVKHKGLNVLMEILARTQTVPWPQRLVKLKVLELASLCVMQKFILHYSPLLLACKGLECCLTSLLHVHVKKYDCIADTESPVLHRHDDLLALVMVRSAVILCGLCEHSDSRLVIAANPTALQQLLNISMVVPKERQINEVGILAPQVAVALLLGVSYSVATHRHLANPALLEAAMETSKMERPWCRGNNGRNVLLIKYLASMFLAQLFLMSPREISPHLYQPVLSFMEEFLLTPDYIEVMMQELKRTFVWTTFVPYVRLLYTCDEINCNPWEVELVSALKSCSLEIVILGLHSMLVRDNHRKVVIDEGLVDYLVCLPPHMPEALRPKSRDLVQLIFSQGDVTVQPPRLINLAKAKLAKMYFGLEYVLSTPVSEIVNRIFVCCK